MPHAIVKLVAGKSEGQKQELTKAIARSVATILDYGEEAVSVAFEEVPPSDWFETVYEPDIRARWSSLTKEPGYEPPAPSDN